MRRLQLRHVPAESVVHRLRADAKILTVATTATAIVFRPDWPVIGIGWAIAAAVFAAARLPAPVLAPPPPLFFYAMTFGGLFTLFSGGEPVVGGVELGGLLDFLRLMAVGLLVISFSALLAWTTSISDIGLGLGRIMRPLRFLGLPADELATVVMLATRALPLVRDELWVTAEARAVRPQPRQRTVADQLRDGVDFGSTVLVGAHRRSRELAKAMVARGSVRAPVAEGQQWRAADWLVVGATFVTAVLTVLFG